MNCNYLIKKKHLLRSIFHFRSVSFMILGFVLLCSSSHLLSQTVTGQVVDEEGIPLIGVNILIKNSSTGTATDIDGNYDIRIPDGGTTLVFSYTGYETQEVPINGRNTINLVLSTASEFLDEIVVVGYGVQKKSDVTGSLVNVDPEKQADVPNTNFLQVIKGNVPGITVGATNTAGGTPSFKIRGTNSISAGNQPLIVIDGIIYTGPLNNININDIESVDVLKDASAAAVYGSRSANGVLLITTKSGGTEKPEFRFTGRYGVSNPVKLIPVLNPQQYQQKILDLREATGLEADPAKIKDYMTLTEAKNLEAGKTIDWYKELVGSAETKDFTASVSGRTSNTNYYISGSVYDQGGIVENDNYQRISTIANFTNEVNDWLSLSLKTAFNYQDYSGVAVPLTYGLSPYSNWYKDGADSGELEYFPMEDPYFRHPLLNLEIQEQDLTNDLRGIFSSVVKVPWVEGLQWTMNYSRNNRTSKYSRFDNNTLAITQNGSGQRVYGEVNTWTFDNIVNYNKTIDVHSLGLTFLVSREYQNFDQTAASSTDYFSQGLGYYSLELGAVPSVSSAFTEQNQNALMGRINYVYNDKYAVTGTIRRDGFSGFAPGNKYATFYSGALSWIMSHESFIEDISWIDYLKLRVSYGENGNQAIDRYQTLARLSSDRPYVFGDGGSTVNGAYVTSMANPSLGWETTKVFNVGMDFDFFNRKLYGSIDVYDSNTEDLLIQRSIPGTTGFSSVLTNIGKVHNNGFEMALSSVLMNKNDFRWDLGFVMDLNRNRIVSLYGEDEDGDGVEDDDIANGWFIGQPLGVYYSYGIDGIYQTGDELPSGYEPGDFRIVDFDGDGALTPDDRHILGNNNPYYQFSVNSTLKYKNFSLFVMVHSIQGGGKRNYYHGNNIIGHNPNQPFASWSERFSFPAMDYWTPTNPSNTAARINYQPPRGHPYLENRSFIRIQDLILSYDFGQNLLENIGIGGLRFFVSGKNLATFTKWTGYDPENASTINSLPMLRTYTMGVDLNF